MSRSSKSYAGFFPQAISVIKEKRSRNTESRKRPHSPPAGESKTLSALSTVASAVSDGDGVDAADATCATREDTESLPGDLLNGVGSASSSSTADSIFSANPRTLGNANSLENCHLDSLTPLTNVDSSPPSNTAGSPRKREISMSTAGSTSGRVLSHYRTPETLRSALPANVLLCPLQARPGRGEIKGEKVLYDPELDKKLNSKERKSRQVLSKTFGDEVCAMKDVEGAFAMYKAAV